MPSLTAFRGFRLCQAGGMQSLLHTLQPLAAVCGAVLLALVIVWCARRLLQRLLRATPDVHPVTKRANNPARLVLSVLGARIALAQTAAGEPWFDAVDYALVLVLIAALAWFLAVVLMVVETVVLTRYAIVARDTRRLKRLETQIVLARRIGVALVITLAVATVLLTIDEVRALGAGILASAGLISIVAGLAVQSSLSNVFAGVQLAFTGAIRVDDVVVVEKSMGTIEEITLTYVVVQVWDERRIILPSTYFTSTPFENWTRRRSELLGTVELDLDWHAPIGALRDHLDESLRTSALWDGRTGALQVTDAVEGVIRARILVSAADSGSLWDLRCQIRESMVAYLQEHFPDALPRQRWESVRPVPGSGRASDDVPVERPRPGGASSST